MSEARRIARALLAERDESFATRHPLAQSQARLARALAAVPVRATRFAHEWREEQGAPMLQVHFAPLARTRLWLRAMSVGLTILVACSAWVVASADEQRTLKILLPIFTVLAILAMPFVVVALGSQREAEEAQVRRAIRRALLDEELAPMQRWADED